MSKNEQMHICANHLPELFDALKRDDIYLVKKIEHKLTREELCVACTYPLAIKGAGSAILEEYLMQEGYISQSDSTSAQSVNEFYWVMRLLFFAMISASVFFSIAWLKTILFKSASLFSFTVLDFIIIGTIAIFLFAVLDDKLFD